MGCELCQMSKTSESLRLYNFRNDSLKNPNKYASYSYYTFPTHGKPELSEEVARNSSYQRCFFIDNIHVSVGLHKYKYK